MEVKVPGVNINHQILMKGIPYTQLDIPSSTQRYILRPLINNQGSYYFKLTKSYHFL